MRKFLTAYFVFICGLLSSQVNPTVEAISTPCGCDVYLFQPEVLDPSDPPTPFPDGSISVSYKGNLDRFVDYKNGICKRSVMVQSRRVVNQEIKYYQDFMVNDLNTLLETYKEYSTFCFKGEFEFSKTIVLKFAKSLKFLDGTVINYEGDGMTAGISFEGVASKIIGGEIITPVNMTDGLIKIQSEGLAIKSNPFSNVIKDITLTSTAANNVEYADGQAKAEDAKQNRAIHLDNKFESLVKHTENGTNYHANIIDVEIDGFAVGLNMRGWSNAAHVRDVRFNNISAYGLWISGCVDNSFANLTFTNSPNAFAIRLDNYVDDRYLGFEMGGETVIVGNPNERFDLSTDKILGALIDDSADQQNFNDKLLDDYFKRKPDNYVYKNYENAPSYFAILEACGIGGDNPFDNEIGDLPGNEFELLRFGLVGYVLDGVQDEEIYDNYKGDGKGIKNISNIPADPTPLYKATFNRPDPNGGSVTLSEGATCSASAGLTNFFKRPALNSFTGVDIFDGEIMQVANLVLLEQREDDDLLCQNISTNPMDDCLPCEYDINGNFEYAFGFDNKIFICLPNGVDISTLDKDNTPSQCTNPNVLHITPLK